MPQLTLVYVNDIGDIDEIKLFTSYKDVSSYLIKFSEYDEECMEDILCHKSLTRLDPDTEGYYKALSKYMVYYLSEDEIFYLFEGENKVKF